MGLIAKILAAPFIPQLLLNVPVVTDERALASVPSYVLDYGKHNSQSLFFFFCLSLYPRLAEKWQ